MMSLVVKFFAAGMLFMMLRQHILGDACGLADLLYRNLCALAA
jgi:hypothetical protein